MRHIAYLLWVLSVPSVCAQSTFSSTNLHPLDEPANAVAVRQYGDSLIVFTHKLAYDGSAVNVFTEGYGPDGSLLWEKRHTTARAALFGYWDPISKAGPSGEFFGGMITVGSGQPDSLFLVRFDHKGDLEMRSYLAQDHDIVPRDVVRAGQHIYTAFTRRDSVGAPSRAIVIRSDTLGNILWEQEFPTLWASTFSIAVNQFEELYLTGYDNGALFPYRSRMLRCDTAGNIVWSQPFMSNWSGTSSHSAIARKATFMDNGDPLVAGSCWDEDGIGAAESEQFLLRLDRASGGKLWLSRFDTAVSEWANLDDVDLAMNGDILSCGYITPTDIYGFYGAIYRSSSAGTLLWKRRYRFLPGNNSLNFLNDVTELSDGSLALCGTTQLDVQFGTVIWVLKLDADGCLVPGCGSVDVIEIPLLSEAVVRMWPNPTSDLLQVEINPTNPSSAKLPIQYSIHTTSGQGQQISGTLQPGLNAIATDRLASGSYILMLHGSSPAVRSIHPFVVSR
jgi:hypothetical protein